MILFLIKGILLSLNDGSEWGIDSFGLHNIDWEWNLLSLFGLGWKQKWTILNWDKGDSIEIQYPIGGNLFGFFMIITNLSRKEYAYVTIKNPPHYDHPSSLWIVNFDKVNQNQFTILLNDGTQWLMSQKQCNMYGAMGDAIYLSYLWNPGDMLTLIRGESGIGGEDLYYLWNHSNNEILLVNKQKELIQTF